MNKEFSWERSQPGYVLKAKQHCAQLLSCVWLCGPVNCSLPGSSVYGIIQARILEWVAISSFRGSSRPRDWTHISCVSIPLSLALGGTLPLVLPGKQTPRVHNDMYHIHPWTYDRSFIVCCKWNVGYKYLMTDKGSYFKTGSIQNSRTKWTHFQFSGWFSRFKLKH